MATEDFNKEDLSRCPRILMSLMRINEEKIYNGYCYYKRFG